ncbi:meprin A subunit alpha-like, partial [Dreissena polymorpha]|uniref:meprin A subunit alpha-like n=1 Tax=Dreissena polymorpha TaxID=45954 RepID=UPI00226455C8
FKHRNAINDRRRRWANGIVPYEISSTYPATVQTIFKQAMAEIEEKTKVNGKTCIHFKPHAGEPGYVKFVTGNGYFILQSPTLIKLIISSATFPLKAGQTETTTSQSIRKNIQKGTEGNFNKYPTGYIDMLGQPYDYGSIMHYSAYAFAIDPHKMTIEPKRPGVTIGQRTALSPTDIKEIQLLYDCIAADPNGHTSDPFVTAPPTTTPAPPTGSDVCTFETGLCTWTNSHSDTMDWTRYHGSTPSANTGPTTDYTGSTSHYYLYLEATGHANKVARLDSKLYPGGDYCVDFYAHMHGSGIGSLYLNVKAGNQIIHLQSWSGEHGTLWAHIRLNAKVHTTGYFNFEFEGHTTSSQLGDIAIDDITIHPGNC